MTDTAKDTTPALATAGAEFDVDHSNLNLETFPGFKPQNRLLPADRMNLQLDLAKIAAALPERFKNEEGTTTNISFDTLTPEDMDALSAMFTQMQNMVLSAATDTDAMTNWLIDQPEPMEGLMYAFGQYQETLGN